MKTIPTAVRKSWDHLKSIWWLQVIAFFVIAIIIFAVLIQVFKSTAVSPNNWADMIYNFFNDWALVFSASVTLLLAFAAFLAILDNRHTRNLDRKEHRLKEIIDWAENTKTTSLSVDFSYTPKQQQANILLRYGSSLSKHATISTIIKEIFKNELYEYDKIVIETLPIFMCLRLYKFSGEWPEYGVLPKTAIDKAKEEFKTSNNINDLYDKYDLKLTNSVNDLLEEANKTKASLITK